MSFRRPRGNTDSGGSISSNVEISHFLRIIAFILLADIRDYCNTISKILILWEKIQSQYTLRWVFLPETKVFNMAQSDKLTEDDRMVFWHKRDILTGLEMYVEIDASKHPGDSSHNVEVYVMPNFHHQ